MALELVPLATGTIHYKDPVILEHTPRGTRAVIEMHQIEWYGDRIAGELVGPSAVDWLLIGPDGSGAIEVAFTLKTHDGALINISYYGRSDVSAGPGTAPLYSAPVFETGDPRYLWLNKIMAVGKAVDVGHRLDYEFYELR